MVSRDWVSQFADQAPQIEDRAPVLGGQASTKNGYLRKSGWPDVVFLFLLFVLFFVLCVAGAPRSGDQALSFRNQASRLENQGSVP